MSLKTTVAPCALLLAAAFTIPAHAQTSPSQDVATLDTVIVTGVRNPEDPPVVADARSRGLLILPVCPFFAAFFQKHPDQADVVHPAYRISLGLPDSAY